MVYAVSDSLKEPQTTFHDAHNRLMTRLGEVGDPFGSDATGNSFRVLYMPGAENATNVAQNVDAGFISVQNNFDLTGRSYDDTESSNSH